MVFICSAIYDEQIDIHNGNGLQRAYKMIHTEHDSFFCASKFILLMLEKKQKQLKKNENKNLKFQFSN